MVKNQNWYKKSCTGIFWKGFGLQDFHIILLLGWGQPIYSYTQDNIVARKIPSIWQEKICLDEYHRETSLFVRPRLESTQFHHSFLWYLFYLLWLHHLSHLFSCYPRKQNQWTSLGKDLLYRWTQKWYWWWRIMVYNSGNALVFVIYIYIYIYISLFIRVYS